MNRKELKLVKLYIKALEEHIEWLQEMNIFIDKDGSLAKQREHDILECLDRIATLQSIYRIVKESLSKK